ncbi:MAG: thiol:disulfide interchange protein [Herbaspirillum sp.]|jgi:thiol:disulfide interchange protein DsbC|nr:thiol:disulfide interchange protein [Herbaspirillum sp.]
MLKSVRVFALLLAVLALPASAQTQEAIIKKAIEPRLGEGAKVTDVIKTPYSGLYEVDVNGDVIYTDASGKYLFIGRVVDAQTYRDYTKERTEALLKMKFSDLPLNLAMKKVKGDGSRTIAVFEDPNCIYCKKFQQTLKSVDNVTVYTFMYNILSPDSVVKSKDIWCSADSPAGRAQVWDRWMSDGVAPKITDEVRATCTAPNQEVLELGQKLKVTGTPTIFFADGSRVPGAIDAAGLEKEFKRVYTPKS